MKSKFLLYLLGCTVLLGCSEQGIETTVTALATTTAEERSTRASSPASVDEQRAAAEVFDQPNSDVAGKVHQVRKQVADSLPEEVPGVFLSTEHSAYCRVRVGDPFPEMTLPVLGGDEVSLHDRFGEQATVVMFWEPDRWMAQTAQSDLTRDVVARFDAEQVAVIGVAVKQSAEEVKQQTTEAKADFPQLLDSDGKAFNRLGIVALPRIYVLDPKGTIIWFDIEYSESTRRELSDTLTVLTAGDEE